MYNVVELCCGAGGMALGLEKAGFNVMQMADVDEDCISTIRHNTNWPTILEEVKNLNPIPHIDLLSAGFPCQPFSYAGKCKGFNGDTRGTVFFDILQYIDATQPRLCILENVKGLLTHDKGRSFETICSNLRNRKYNVHATLLNSINYEVPQMRERVIIVATKEYIRYEIPYPVNKVLTLRDALKDCPPSDGMKYSERRQKILELVPAGGNWRDLPIDIQQEYLGKTYFSGGGRTGIAKRLAWDKPSPTILCSPVQKFTDRCHPDEVRPLTIRETARIQTFPDSWMFMGSVTSQYKQIGNAVPVNMAYHIGITLRNMLDSSY